ncbi:hypothetical protein Tco_0221114 [Tanacetum coccineum]
MSDSVDSTATYTEVSSPFEDLSDIGSPGVIIHGYNGLTMMPEDLYTYVEKGDLFTGPQHHQLLPDPKDPEQAPPSQIFYMRRGGVPPETMLIKRGEQYEDEETPISIPFAAKVDRFLAISTPPSSPLTSYSSLLPHIPSPPLLVSSPLPISRSTLLLAPTHPLTIELAMIRLRSSMAMMRAAVPSTYILAPRLETPPSGTPPLLLILLPTTSPPLLLPSTNYRADVPEVTLLPRNRLCIAPGSRYEVGESSFAPTGRPTGGFRADYGFFGTLDAEIRRDPDREIGYGITDIWEDPDEIIEEIPMTDVVELGQRMTNFITTIRHGTNEIYRRLDDAHDDRSLMSGQLNLLTRIGASHARHCKLMRLRPRLSREAWYKLWDASDTTPSEVRALQTMVLA